MGDRVYFVIVTSLAMKWAARVYAASYSIQRPVILFPRAELIQVSCREIACGRGLSVL